MVQRPPFDRGNMPPGPPPGGFDPRFGGRHEAEQRFNDGPDPDPRFDPRDPRDRFDPRDTRDPRFDSPDPFDRRQPPPPPSGHGPGPARSNRWLWILGGLLLLGAILFGLSLTRSGPGSDALENDSGGEGTEETAAAADPEARCAAPATYEAMKRELFRQAGATRGSDQATFDSLAAYAALRVTKPVLREQDEGLERVSCSADVALDLPPGVQVVGGRRTLTALLGYNLQPAADRSGDVVTLTGAEGIVVPLATVARTGAAAQPGAADGVDSNGAPLGNRVPTQDEVPQAPQAPPPPRPAPRPVDAAPDGPAPPAASPPTASARPSFNCARARTRGEIAVCNSSELAALDRQMANFFNNARRGADPETRALLERTRSRFLGFRDRCRSDACVADAYRGRITEIRDIVDGRWQAN